MKQFFLFFTIVLTTLFYSCSPKVVEKKIETPKEEVKKVVDEGPRPTPCTMFKDLDDGEDVKGMFVVYRNFMKTNEWDEAYAYWTEAVHLAPGSNGRVKYHFDDGVKIFKHYYNIEKDASKKKMWIDSINWIYDKRVECFGEEAYNLGRKAFDYYYYFSNDVSQDEIFNLFARAVDEKKEKADYFVINPFSKMIYDRYRSKKLSEEDTKHYANIMVDAINYGSTHCKGTECQAWDMIKDYSPALLENFEGIKNFYSDSYYSDKYLKLLEKGKDNCDTANLVYRKLLWGGCDINKDEYAGIRELKSGKCYVAPPEPGPLRKAFMLYNQGKYKLAIASFEEFVNNTDDANKKAKYLFKIAKIYYRDLKNYPKARAYSMKAVKHKAGWGEPYMLIGKLYASSGPICGPGRGWDSQIVTWPAIDKFKYAKKIDPSVSKEANQLINSYQKYMPNMEDIFQRTLKVGQKFKIGCWINETTVIRAAK